MKAKAKYKLTQKTLWVASKAGCPNGYAVTPAKAHEDALKRKERAREDARVRTFARQQHDTFQENNALIDENCALRDEINRLKMAAEGLTAELSAAKIRHAQEMDKASAEKDERVAGLIKDYKNKIWWHDKEVREFDAEKDRRVEAVVEKCKAEKREIKNAWHKIAVAKARFVELERYPTIVYAMVAFKTHDAQKAMEMSGVNFGAQARAYAEMVQQEFDRIKQTMI